MGHLLSRHSDALSDVPARENKKTIGKETASWLKMSAISAMK